MLQNRLLVVDDEAAICSLIKRVAEPLGFVVQSLTESARFRQTLSEFNPSLLILDLKMPDCDGVQLLQQLKDDQSEAQIMVISGMDQRVLNTAEKLGRSQGLRMAGVLHKPLKRVELQLKLSDALSESNIFSRERFYDAMSNREFVVHYQPKASRTDGGWLVDGGEALLRWQHPELGLLLPGRFLPFVGDQELIELMTNYVLEESLKQLAEWKRKKIEIRLAVNLSATLIDDLAFPEHMGRLLQKYGVPGRMLRLELTESTAMADATKAMDIFLRLCMNDISLSIDDFGTGFSSLQQLYQLPFNELKIDRMFVRNLPDDHQARAIVRATIGMAHALNIKVCAEGVETSAALEYLESVVCDGVQGHLISAAVPPAEFENLLGAWKKRDA